MDSNIRGIDDYLFKLINITIAGIITPIFRIGYEMSIENKTIPVEEEILLI
jgi:hypothetical protein